MVSHRRRYHGRRTWAQEKHWSSFAEKRAEYRGRQRLDPEPRATLMEAKERYPEGQLPVDDLLRSYFMYYAAALAAPDESADVTLERWLKS